MTAKAQFDILTETIGAINHLWAAAPIGALSAKEIDLIEGELHRLHAERRKAGERLYAELKAAAEAAA